MGNRLRQLRTLAVLSFLGSCIVLLASILPAWGESPDPNRLHVPITIPGLTGELRSLRFYGTSLGGPVEYQKRKYQTTFVASKDRYISWELTLDHPFSREDSQRFVITAALYDPSGTLLTKSEALAWIEPDMPWSQWGSTFAVDEWKAGTYQVAIVVQGKELTRVPFQMSGETGPGEDFLKTLGATVTALRFYESDDMIPPSNERKYSQRFVQSKTRSIYWELNLQYPGTRPNPVNFTVNALWYGPDNRVMQNLTTKHTIQGDWTDSYHTSGYGQIEPGRWKPGTYRVVLKVNNREVANGSFEVVGDLSTVAEPGSGDWLQQLDVSVDSVRFFENGKSVPPSFQRTYQETFSRAATKYIYWDLTLRVGRPGSEPMSVSIEETWYDPSGKMMGQFPNTFTLRPGAKAVFTSGVGQDQPGKWQTGEYRVVLKTGGKVLATGSFQVISEPAPTGKDILAELGAKVTAVKFFEGPAEGRKYGQRTYRTSFASANTRFIFYELNLEFKRERPESVDLVLTSLWYDGNGKLFKELNTRPLTIQGDWIDAQLSHGYGWDTPGQWPPDTYQVVIKIGTRVVGSGSFRIR